METNELTVSLLQEIRDKLRDLRESLGTRIEGLGTSLGARIDATDVELRTTREELRAEIQAIHQHLAEHDFRYTTQLHELIRIARHISGKLDRR
jgi:3-dehydroquinate dehydratase